MPDSFSVDVDRLHNVAKTDLPYIIDAINGGRSQLTTAAGEQSSAFDGDLYHAEGITSTPVGNSFGYAEYVAALLDDLQSGLGNLSDNLTTSKAALQEVANRYRQADGQPPYAN